MELKKPHASRLVGGAETWIGQIPHPHVVDKNSGGISQEWGVPASHQASPAPAQDSSAGKINPHNFWLQNPVGIELVEELLESGEPTHGLTQTHSLCAPAPGGQLEKHQWHTGRNWSMWHQGRSWGTTFPKIERLAVPLQSHKASRQVPYQRFHQPG